MDLLSSADTYLKEKAGISSTIKVRGGAGAPGYPEVVDRVLVEINSQ
jgi:hypothetical protein